jgi:hypothetical protein
VSFGSFTRRIDTETYQVGVVDKQGTIFVYWLAVVHSLEDIPQEQLHGSSSG